MKTIEPISIWDNGVSVEATVLNTYASNVILNSSATFWYGLYQNPDGPMPIVIAQGYVSMTGEAYEQWEIDSYAWDFVASSLNLVITGDYVPPIPEPIIVEQPIIE